MRILGKNNYILFLFIVIFSFNACAMSAKIKALFAKPKSKLELIEDLVKTDLDKLKNQIDKIPWDKHNELAIELLESYGDRLKLIIPSGFKSYMDLEGMFKSDSQKGHTPLPNLKISDHALNNETCTFSKCGKYFITSASDNCIQKVEVPNFLVTQIPVEIDGVQKLLTCQNSQYIALTSQGNLILYNIKLNKFKRITYPNRGFQLKSIQSFGPDNNKDIIYLIFSQNNGSEASIVKIIWNENMFDIFLMKLDIYGCYMTESSVSPDGKYARIISLGEYFELGPKKQWNFALLSIFSLNNISKQLKPIEVIKTRGNNYFQECGSLSLNGNTKIKHREAIKDIIYYKDVISKRKKSCSNMHLLLPFEAISKKIYVKVGESRNESFYSPDKKYILRVNQPENGYITLENIENYNICDRLPLIDLIILLKLSLQKHENIISFLKEVKAKFYDEYCYPFGQDIRLRCYGLMRSYVQQVLLDTSINPAIYPGNLKDIIKEYMG